MKSIRNVYILLIALLIIAFIFLYGIYFFMHKNNSNSETSPQSHITTSTSTENLVIDGKTYIAELANTPALQTHGLSDRLSLSSDHVMLFVFNYPQDIGIWMKDMNFSLDIIWLDAEGKIVTIQKNVSPSTYPEVFHSTTPSLYVIEANPGFVDSNHLEVGSIIPIQI